MDLFKWWAINTQLLSDNRKAYVECIHIFIGRDTELSPTIRTYLNREAKMY